MSKKSDTLYPPQVHAAFQLVNMLGMIENGIKDCNSGMYDIEGRELKQCEKSSLLAAHQLLRLYVLGEEMLPEPPDLSSLPPNFIPGLMAVQLDPDKQEPAASD